MGIRDISLDSQLSLGNITGNKKLGNIFGNYKHLSRLTMKALGTSLGIRNINLVCQLKLWAHLWAFETAISLGIRISNLDCRALGTTLVIRKIIKPY